MVFINVSSPEVSNSINSIDEMYDGVVVAVVVVDSDVVVD